MQLEQIKNIVVVFQENHTFDNYFATYPNSDGIAGKTICLQKAPRAPKEDCVAPFHFSSLTPPEMSHSWESAHADYDEGRMDGFVYCEGSTQTMGYFERGDLELYWQVADKYVLCDRYSSSVMSQSAPNHLYLVAASCGGIIKNKVPKTLDFPPVFKQLDEEGITWKVYTKDPNSSWFRNFSYVQNMSNLDKNFARNDEFSKDVESGNLCQVSWIVGAPGGDEHPPANVQLGERSVISDVVNAVGQSDSYWNGSAIFVTWDDYGGFFDHVPPPQIDEFGYGFRVPCLVISPYAKSGFIDSMTNDHTSILKFIESRFNLEPLGSRDAAANSMEEAFNFSISRPRPFNRIL